MAASPTRKGKPADPNAIVEAYRREDAQLGQWRELWQELGEHLTPWKSAINRTRQPGEKQTEKIFDSTGGHAVDILTSSLHSGMTPVTQKWLNLAPRQEEFRSVQSIRAWGEETAQRTYSAYGQSNFAEEITEAYEDLVVFGTCAFLQLERPSQVPGQFGGFLFRELTIGDYTIEENPEGRVDRLTRRVLKTARQLVREFGEDTVGDRLKEIYARKPETPVEILHAVYPREDRFPIEPGRSKLGMPFASCYVEPHSRHLISESGFQEFPYAVCRWRKSAYEVMGRGPATTALPDVRSLNRAIEIYLGAAAMALHPPLNQLHQAVLGSVTLEPAGINIVKEKGALEPMDNKMKVDVAQMLGERLERKIREMLYVDRLQLQAEGPQMTLGEAQIRVEMMQRLMGPAAGRIYSELLKPTVERSVALQYRAGALPPPPEELLTSNVDLDVEYEGPLARAQRVNDLVAVDRKNQWVTVQVQLGNTDVIDLFDLDAEGKLVAELSGYPADLMRDEQAVAQIRQGRAQQQQAAQQMQAIQQMGETAGKAAPALKVMQDARQNAQNGQPQAAAA